MPSAIQNSYLTSRFLSEEQSKYSVFYKLIYGLASKFTKFILNNPAKTITLILTGQVLGNQAISGLQNRSVVEGNNSSLDRAYLADTLAMIEQRVAPVLSLASLNNNDTNLYETNQNNRRERIISYLLLNDVCLRNVHKNNEYLYLSAFRRLRSIGRSFTLSNYIFTWIPGNEVKEASWHFESDDNGKTFFIKNKYYKQYLYATRYKYSNRRHLSSALNGNKLPGGRWRVELLAAEDSVADKDRLYIALWNDHYNEPLYAAIPTYDHDRRHVFTWGSENYVEEARWRVEYCGPRRRRTREVFYELENTIPSSGKENASYLDKTVANLKFFQIKQSEQSNKTFEADFITGVGINIENKIMPSQLNGTI